MRIIISPAKKMNEEPDLLAYRQTPACPKEASTLLGILKQCTYEQCKQIWNCSDAIATLNYKRVQQMDLEKRLTPAILSYEGIQYQHMAPSVLPEDALDYLEEHLRILSGFYGILRPFDGIVPYRLEMQARLGDTKGDSLYEFWGEKLAKCLQEETDCILNLASKEYSKSISKHLKKETRFITCVFGEWKDGKVKEKGTQVKMARGEMVRFLAEERINEVERIKEFSRQGFAYEESLSDEATFVFIKQGTNEGVK